MRRGSGREGGGEGDEEEEIGRGEVREVMRRLKDGKAVGSDGIPNEVWKYERGGGKRMDVRGFYEGVER